MPRSRNRFGDGVAHAGQHRGDDHDRDDADDDADDREGGAGRLGAERIDGERRGLHTGRAPALERVDENRDRATSLRS